MVGPGQRLDHLTVPDPEAAGLLLVDDTRGEGLYGYDARTTFEVEQGGLHRIRVYTNDLSTVRFRFSARPCRSDCD